MDILVSNFVGTVTIGRPDECGVRRISWTSSEGRRCEAFAKGILKAWRIAQAVRRGDLSALHY